MSGCQEGSGQEGLDFMYKSSQCKLQFPEQCPSLSKASMGTGAASGKPKLGSLSQTSAHGSTLHAWRQLKIRCRRELLVTCLRNRNMRYHIPVFPILHEKCCVLGFPLCLIPYLNRAIGPRYQSLFPV